MISISRLLIHQFRSLLHRAGIRPAGPMAPVRFIADAAGLRIRSHNADVAVEYHQPGSLTAEQFAAPQAFLDDCEGRKDEPVALEVQPDGRIVAQWRDGGVPQLTQYDAEDPARQAPFPGPPATWAENPSNILPALNEAVLTTSTDVTRYSLNCFQLRGQAGTIAATNGHELLWQTGFQFPWEEDLLVPANKVFSSTVLPEDQPVRVGEAGGWVVFACGPWTIWLAKFVDGKFPKLADTVSPTKVPVCRCTFTADDLRFLAQKLKHLPIDEGECPNVTIDLNGQPKFRARGIGHAEPTEIVLAGTSVEGEPLSVASDRKFLERAVRLGMTELHLSGKDTQLRASDERRTYIWMPLYQSCIVPASPNAIHIEPQPEKPAAETAPPKPKRKPVPKVPTPLTETAPAPAEPVVKLTGAAPAGNEPAAKPKQTRESRPTNLTSPIELAKALRVSQRETIVKTNDLIAALRRQQRQNKAVASTLAQLKQLQKIA